MFKCYDDVKKEMIVKDTKKELLQEVNKRFVNYNTINNVGFYFSNNVYYLIKR